AVFAGSLGTRRHRRRHHRPRPVLHPTPRQPLGRRPDRRHQLEAPRPGTSARMTGGPRDGAYPPRVAGRPRRGVAMEGGHMQTQPTGQYLIAVAVSAVGLVALGVPTLTPAVRHASRGLPADWPAR